MMGQALSGRPSWYYDRQPRSTGYVNRVPACLARVNMGRLMKLSKIGNNVESRMLSSRSINYKPASSRPIRG